MDVDDFAPRLSFFFNAHIDFFEEIAKYRAARRIWARELRERYGAKRERSLLMRFHTQTAGVSLTAQQPEVNIVRTAVEALAAVLGGTQSLHTNSYDEALALPTEGAARLALRTQQVIAHETGVVHSADPLGGSWLVEAMTDRLEREAYDYFERIERLGGVIAALNENFFQREIAEASYRYQQEVEDGRRLVVGVNSYTSEDDDQVEILRISPEVERRQKDRLNAVRGRRDAAVGAGLARAALGRRRHRPQRHAGAGRLRPRVRHRGRDLRRPAGRVGRLPRDARLLTHPGGWDCPASWDCPRSMAPSVSRRMAPMDAFEIDGLEAARSAEGQLYHEFLRRDSMSVGPLRAARPRGGSADAARAGRALLRRLRARRGSGWTEHDRPVDPGSIIFVPAEVDHRFHSITSDLSILVVFAPPET